MIHYFSNPEVKRAVEAYEERHGGSFGYLEPTDWLTYFDESGHTWSFDRNITDEEFIERLENDTLQLTRFKIKYDPECDY